ncbi:hypothetical protein HDU76_000627 [Blyttiomyces sp. JEL0837]|nr:hypothetical protein HDU76_000627 [Blyttiomyces sp. JEL0837]
MAPSRHKMNESIKSLLTIRRKAQPVAQYWTEQAAILHDRCVVLAQLSFAAADGDAGHVVIVAVLVGIAGLAIADIGAAATAPGCALSYQ